MKTIRQIPKTLVFITILLLSTTTGNAQNQSISVNGIQIQVTPTVQNVLKQVEIVYVKPTGYSINNFYNDAPDVIPTFLGLIMHRQEMMMNEIRNVEHLDNFLAVEKEIMAFLDQLAQAHNYRNPADNTSMPAARLNVYYLEAVRGNQNANFRKNMGIDPTKVQITYMLDKNPNLNNNDVDEYAKLQIKKKTDENANEIKLLGVSVIGDASHSQDNIQITGNAESKGLFKAGEHICPDKAPLGQKYYDSGDQRYFVIEQGKGSWEGTRTYCYYKNNLLVEQAPYVNGKRQGLSLTYAVAKNGKRFLKSRYYSVNDKKHGLCVRNEEFTYQGNILGIGKTSSIMWVNGQWNGPYKRWYMSDSGINYLKEEGNYVNGKLDGKRKSYIISKKTGKLYVSGLDIWRNGKLLSVKDYFVLETGKYYQTAESNYTNGKIKEIIYYHSSGGVKHRVYYQNGKFTHSKCWYKSGKEMKNIDCSKVDWKKTDWCKDIKTCINSKEF